jgi:hypothetical protein
MMTGNHQHPTKGTPSHLLVILFLLTSVNFLFTLRLPVTKNDHAAQRLLTHQRRAAKPHSTLLADAKRAWSLARQKTISKEERASHVASLMGIVRGKIQDIVFKHDASRIVQTIVRRGDQLQRNEVATELRGRFKELVENKYSKVKMFDAICVQAKSAPVPRSEACEILSFPSSLDDYGIPLARRPLALA